jgi:non-ribosomal peptide synthetase component E (peptide arylation enzyme)
MIRKVQIQGFKRFEDETFVFPGHVVKVNLRPGDRGTHGQFELRDGGREQLTKVAAFTADGFLRSGDLGRVHVIGDRRCYTVDGRLKDQISRGGEKFMAAELELLLHDHPDVREVAAIGVPDPKLGERVCVVVIPEPGSRDVPPEELRRRLVEHLDRRDVAKFKWPERLVLVDELPKTAIGKVQKDVLRDRVVSGAEPSEVRA